MAFMVLVLVSGCAQQDQQPAPPRETAADATAANVIVVVVDTLRADRLGCYGHPRPTSPEIDRLAAEGARFTAATAPSPWTIPSTASILTSRHPAEHGAEVTGEIRRLHENPPKQIREGVGLLSEIVSENGLATALMSANPFLFGRFTDGFDHAVVDRMPADRLTAETISWLDGLPEGTPFLVHLQYMDLHQPLEPPDPYRRLFATPEAGPREARHSEWAFSGGQHLDTPEFESFRANRLALYDGALRFVDDQIGVLRSALADRDLLRSTLLVVTSDHGEEFWDHAEVGAAMGGDPRGYYGIGHGHAFFQELLQVPLVIWGPSIASGVTVEGPASLLDIAPTVLAWLGLTPPDVMRGIDLTPTIAIPGERRVRLEPRDLFASSPAYGPETWTVISEEWKLIVRSDGHRLLFDLSQDPLEQQNLAASRAGVAAEHEALLERHRASATDVPSSDAMEIDEELREELRALGYVH